MSYTMLRGVGQDEEYDPELDFCDSGEYFDINKETCVCQPGYIPDLISGGGCIRPEAAVPEANRLPSLPSPTPSVPRPQQAAPPGSTATPTSQAAAVPTSTWLIGGAVLLGVVVLGVVASKTATPNRRRSRRNAAPHGPPRFGHEKTPREIRDRIKWETWAAKLARRHGRNGDAIGHELTAARYEQMLDRMAITVSPNRKRSWRRMTFTPKGR
jgi:hypothetical protein